MSIWYAIPSKRPQREADAVLSAWRRHGYKTAVWRDFGDQDLKYADITHKGKYRGYAVAVNMLCKTIIANDPNAEWIVTGGDDVHPDPNHSAEQIGRECTQHFGGTFGVMQPTGDRWGEDPNMPNHDPMRGAYADRVCSSPFMGREFCQRMYGGNGPLYHEYAHMGVDEELQHVASILGVLWQRRDLVHLHQHWARTTGQMPAFLSEANSPEHWERYKTLFTGRKANGFPGHEPLHVGASRDGSLLVQAL